MYERNLTCVIRSAKVVVEPNAPEAWRRCRIQVEREFDHVIADALGKEGKAARAGLKALGMETVVLPITALMLEGRMTSGRTGEMVSLREMRGTKATAKTPKHPDDEPRIVLEFEFPWEKDAWNFLGEHVGTSADLWLRKRQLEFIEVGTGGAKPAHA